MKENSIKFFLGSSTRSGFVPLFEDIRDTEAVCLYILKGGAGSGKSSMMKKLGEALENAGDFVEYIPCASDPDSLDAIIDCDRGIAMVDGTPPHVLEAKFPGAYEQIINTGQAWNTEFLRREKVKIIDLSNRISDCHAWAAIYIKAAGNMLADIRKKAKPFVDESAIWRSVNVLLPEGSAASAPGKERKRLLSAVSVGKIVFFSNTINALCDTVYSLEDDYGAASDVALSLLRQKAIMQGLDVISCYSSETNGDKLDHLILPQKRLGFTTQNRFHSIPVAKPFGGLYRPIPAEKVEAWGEMLDDSQELLDKACGWVKKAKNIHDELESIYVKSMDFSRLDEMYKQIYDEIFDPKNV